MSLRPRLRPEVSIDPDPRGGARLVDGLIGRRIVLGPGARSIVERVDGTRTVGEIEAEVAALAAPIAPATVRGTLRMLALLTALEGAGAATVDRFRRMRRGELALEPKELPDARFECQACGACCRGYAYGPLRDEDVQRLNGLDIAGRAPDVGPGPYLREEADPRGGAPRVFLRSVEGRCVFLRPSGHCAIHATFGGRAKPLFCQTFPLVDTPTIDGIRVYDTGECASFATSATRGGPIGKQLALVKPLGQGARPDPDGTVSILHPLVILGPGRPCDYGYILRLQDALVALAGASSSACDAVMACGRLTLRFMEALGDFPLEPGEPDATVARVLAIGGAELASPAPAPDPEAPAVVAEVARRLLDGTLASVQAGVIDRTPAVRAATAVRLDARRLLEATRERAAGAAGEPVLAELRAAWAIPIDDPALDAAIRLSLRHELFGSRFVAGERLALSVLRMAVAHFMAIVGARVAAQDAGVARVRTHDLDAGLSLTGSIVRNPFATEIFRALEGEAGRVLEALPLLLGA